MSMYQGLILIILACKVLPLVTFITMNNKLFTFLDPLLGYIDNGRFFREPFRWLYVIFAVLNLLFPIFILAKVIEMDFFKYAEGKLILAFILLFIILCAGAWGSYLLWMNRKNKLKEAIQEENEFIAIPVVSHLTQTMGEWLGLYIGVIGTLCSVVIAIFAANEIRYILPIPSGMFLRPRLSSYQQGYFVNKPKHSKDHEFSVPDPTSRQTSIGQ